MNSDKPDSNIPQDMWELVELIYDNFWSNLPENEADELARYIDEINRLMPDPLPEDLK